MAEHSQPLRELLTTKNSWRWDSAQDQAFKQIKTKLTKPTVLALYDVNVDIKIPADASLYGQWAVLLQRENQSWQAVIYASHVMTSTKCRYVQVEKEALLYITWACKNLLVMFLAKSLL